MGEEKVPEKQYAESIQVLTQYGELKLIWVANGNGNVTVRVGSTSNALTTLLPLSELKRMVQQIEKRAEVYLGIIEPQPDEKRPKS